MYIQVHPLYVHAKESAHWEESNGLIAISVSFFSKAFPGVLQQCAGWTETVHMVHALHSIVVLQSVCFIQQWYNIVHIALL